MKAIARYYKRFLAVTAAFFVTVFFTSGFYSKVIELALSNEEPPYDLSDN